MSTSPTCLTLTNTRVRPWVNTQVAPLVGCTYRCDQVLFCAVPQGLAVSAYQVREIKFGKTLCPVAVDLFDADGTQVAVAQVNYIRLESMPTRPAPKS